MSETPIHGEAGRIAPAMAWIAAAAGWFVPGLGHLLLRRWGRAAVIFVCVCGMAMAGYKLRGRVYSIYNDDIFGLLNHIAEIGAGVFYFLARTLEPAGADVARVTGDFGTRLLDIAGLLNFLCVVDAFVTGQESNS